MTSQDLVKGIDIDGLTQVTGSEINQNVDAARLASDKGIRIVTTDTDIDVPDVPNPSDTVEGVEVTFWTRYKWVRLPHEGAGADARVKEYNWNPNRDEDATLLRWELTTLAVDELDTRLDTVEANATLALSQSSAAISSAAVAATNSDAALVQVATANSDISDLDTRITNNESTDETQNNQIATASDRLDVLEGAVDELHTSGGRTDLGLQYTGLGFCLLRDRKNDTVDGGIFNSGAWQTRELNEKISTPGNAASSVTLNNDNTFTLIPGVYLIEIETPGYGVQSHQCRLYRTTDNTVIAYGTSEYASSTEVSQTTSRLKYVTVVGANYTFRVEHRCGSTLASGFGRPCSFGGSEVYTQVKITPMNN